MHPADRIANARAVVKLIQDLLHGIKGGLELTEEGVMGLFLLLQAVCDELEAAERACEEGLKNAA